MSTTRPFPYVRPGATAAVAGPAAALALALTGCTADRNNSAAPATASSRASSPASSPKASPASDRTQYLPGESVTKAPDLPDGKVVARTANAHGNAEIDVPGGIGPGSLSIAVNCEGRGTLNVSVDPTGLSFPLTCAAGKVSGILNRLDRRHADSHAHATVTVTAPAGIRWSLTVGR
ncbi:hypothetical protein ABZV29_14385 [Streptomyces sp. NPDC005236]|uniref:hypothetical protein n=1 Tax=Streptomyces sp. NPDC005236 TaxID=3157028 RepID=UPI0033B333A1